MPLPNSIISYGEYEELQKKSDEKIEYYNGDIVLMSPTSIKHNEIVGNIFFELKSYFKNSKCKVHSEQVSVLFQNETEKYEFQPDVFVICNPEKRGEKYITVPKIIFEVLSKSTSGRDLFVKANIYRKFGVLEYNVVDQVGKIIQYKLEEEQYVISNTYNNKDMYESVVFTDLKFDLKNIFL